MTKRERVLSILRGDTPDKLPWFGDLAYWIGYLHGSNNYPEKYRGEDGVFRMHDDLGIGFYLQGFSPFTMHYENVDVKVDESGDFRTTRYITPVGTLTECWKYIKSTFSSAPVEHLVKDASDLPALRYLYEHTHFEPDYGRIAKYREFSGDNGVTLCYTPRTPFMELTAIKAGIETVTYCIADDEDEFQATMDVMGTSFDKAAEVTVASDCECVMIGENLSSEAVGKKFYHQYIEHHHKKWTAKIKESGKYSFIHMDGTLKGLISEVSNAGFLVLEALTPAPVGDLAIEDFISSASEDVIFWGGLPGAYFSDSFSDEQFDTLVIGIIEYMIKSNRFVLGVADQIPPYTRPERIKRVNELVEEHGVYR